MEKREGCGGDIRAGMVALKVVVHSCLTLALALSPKSSLECLDGVENQANLT